MRTVYNEVINDYTDQPAHLPSEIRRAVEAASDHPAIQLYALADLDATMRLTREWVVLTERDVFIVREAASGSVGECKQIPRSSIQMVRAEPGLSATRLLFLGEADAPALALVRYSHRQQRSMENIQYVLEQAMAGRAVTPDDPDHHYGESLTKPLRDAQASINRQPGAIVWRLLAYLKPYRGRVTIGVVSAVIMTALGLVPPYLTGYLVDDVVKPFQGGSLSTVAASDAVFWIVCAIALVEFLHQSLAWLRLRTMTVMGELIARDLRGELYEHIQSLSLSYFTKKRTGSLISRVSSDTDRLWQFIALGAVDVSLAVVMIIGLSVILIHLDVLLGCIVVAPIPVVFYLIHRHGKYMDRLCRRAWRKWSRMTGVLSDTIPGIRVVKAFSQEEAEKERFRKCNADVNQEFTEIHLQWTRFWPLLMGGIRVTVVAVWVIALSRIVTPSTGLMAGLSLGTFLSFLLYMGMLAGPLQTIGQITFIMNRATSSAHRVFEVLDTEPEVKENPRPRKLAPVMGRVTFEEVTFSYDGVRSILKGINFDVAPGEMIGLVGPSGGGKSTTMNMIMRFYDPVGGRILIDGVPLEDLDLAHFRSQIGMVLQEPYLFHGTIMDNIRYGRDETSAAEIVEAAKAANAHDFICKLAHGYDTMVGERGHSLSGGERQRLSIARAVLGNPRILLLDEATSSVDTETEKHIQDALNRLVEGRTVFAIAHRLSTLNTADRLFVIDDGRITEEGRHIDLMQQPGGKYRKLCELQEALSGRHVA